MRDAPLHVCGVDAGGTKTDCVIATLEGAVLARTLGGSAAVHHGDHFAAAVAAAVAAACSEADADPRRLGVVAGLSGVDTPATRARALAALDDALDVAALDVRNDAEVALLATTDERPAIVLNAGTGSIAYGEDGDAIGCRVGGWGHLFGDEGSGYDVAVRALAAVLRAGDGRGPRTLLAERACEHFGLDDPRRIVELTEEIGRDPTAAAAFAPAVFETAEAGDEVAVAIVAAAAAELAALAISLLERVAPDGDCVVGLAGSLLANDGGYARLVESAVAAAAPPARVVRTALPPVAGAVLAALALHGAVEPADARARLHAALSPSERPIPEVVE